MSHAKALATGDLLPGSQPLQFFLTEEQRQIAATLERFLADRASLDKRRGILAIEIGGDGQDLWRELGALGVLGAALPAENGGLGGGGLEIGLVMDAFGKYLMATPFAQANVLATSLLLAADSGAQLDGVVSGEDVPMPALWEPAHRYEPAHVDARARRQPDGSYQLSGRKTTMFGGRGSSFLVSVREGDGDAADPQGISLFQVPADATGLKVSVGLLFDGAQGTELTLDGVAVGDAQRVGAPGEAFPHIASAIRLAILANCAEAIGAMQAMFDRTLEYVKVRKQFGATLGSFQALQHRLVDMFSAIETARANVQSGLAQFHAWSEPEQSRHVAMVKLYTDQASRLVMRDSVQLHGGMGMTDELLIGHYFKRLLMIRLAFNSTQALLANPYQT